MSIGDLIPQFGLLILVIALLPAGQAARGAMHEPTTLDGQMGGAAPDKVAATLIGHSQWMRRMANLQDAPNAQNNTRPIEAILAGSPTAPSPIAPTATLPASTVTATTVQILQPPTRTPRPTPTPGGPAPTPDRPIAGSEIFHPAELLGAAWTGVLIALASFGLLAAYLFVRAAIRGQLRGWWRAFRRELVYPLFRSFRRRPPNQEQ